MPRPLKASEELRRRFDLYLDESEIEAIRAKATRARLPMSTFVRRAALDVPIEAPPPEVNLRCWQELARLAANLNQVARASNSGQVPEEIAPLINHLSAAVGELRMELLGASK